MLAKLGNLLQGIRRGNLARVDLERQIESINCCRGRERRGTGCLCFSRRTACRVKAVEQVVPSLHIFLIALLCAEDVIQ